MKHLAVESVDEVQIMILEQEDEDDLQKGSIIWNYFKISGVQNKRAGAKNVTCILTSLIAVPLELLHKSTW
jgi:hypothetical protein